MIEDFIIKIADKIINRLDQGYHPRYISDFLLGKKSQGLCFVVSVTTRCNFNCSHCLRYPIDDNKSLIKDLPVDVFETIIKEAKKIDFNSVSFTGGEPILHPRFEELISLCDRYGYSFNFVSNGWLYDKYWEVIEKYRKNFDFVYFSLDGVTPQMHDSVRNKPGSFNKIVEAIKFYRSKSIPVGITFCVTKKNFEHVGLLPSFCIKMDISNIKWVTVIPVSEGGAESVLTDEQRNETLQKILNLQEKFKGRCDFQIASNFFPSIIFKGKPESRIGVNYCSVLNRHSFYIDHDGGMLFCCDINRLCKNKPIVQDIGFEKSLRITLNAINEARKKFLNHKLANSGKINRICEFCNENIEDYLTSAGEQEK